MARSELLYKYHRQSQAWHKMQEGEEKNELLSAVMEIEQTILASYGLPSSSQYSDILQSFGWQKQITDAGCDLLATKLSEAATHYFEAATLTNRELLEHGRKHEFTAVEVLPLMGYGCTPYQCFIWDGIWMRDLAQPNAILDALAWAENNFRFELKDIERLLPRPPLQRNFYKPKQCKKLHEGLFQTQKPYL